MTEPTNQDAPTLMSRLREGALAIGIDRIVEDLGIVAVVEAVGIDMVIEAVGIGMVVEAVGIDRVLGACGPENIARYLLENPEAVYSLPVETRKKVVQLFRKSLEDS